MDRYTYCEINLIGANESGVADFRVEHFHPKSDTSEGINWHLNWQNLFACCHGGSQKNVSDASNRHTSPDHSCDVPKGNKNLDALILNPLEIPMSPALFSCRRFDGALKVVHMAPDENSFDSGKAQKTIDELRLNATRLRRMRRAALNEVNDRLRNLVAAGMSLQEARVTLARALLCKNSQNHLPAFFTSLRGYLGAEAEEYLTSILGQPPSGL